MRYISKKKPVEFEAWDERQAEILLKQFADMVAGNPSGLSTWCEQRGIMPDDSQIDIAFGRRDLIGLRQAVDDSEKEWKRLALWKEGSNAAVDSILQGTLRTVCRLPVAVAWHGIIGRVAVVHPTDLECEKAWSRAGPGECHFHQAEAKEMFQAITRGDDIKAWMKLKYMFRGTAKGEAKEVKRGGENGQVALL